ncbi:MAG: hypothetical protein IKP65_04915 [Alphaproteobacteria bacterium]|nr:hypothetical protein [Alphaproteobacteria bacterium]
MILSYKYYKTFATVNYEKGTVAFNERLNYSLLGTFTNYLYMSKNGNDYPYEYFSSYNSENDDFNKTHAIHNFITTEDDLVDYSEPSFYV